MAIADELLPATFEQAAAALASAAAGERSVRLRGGGTKLDWGLPVEAADLELHTGGLNQVLEHNAGDLTAVLEAGVALDDAQRTFAQAGQMLALDPPLGPGSAATIGGIFATGDCGPLRHRYGAPRDLVVGIAVALSDGTIARAGGKVIKNVAGYDLAKLFCGSFGTLGMILSVNVRLHPIPVATATAVGESHDPRRLGAAAAALAAAPFELEGLDVAWSGGHGRLLARCVGVEAERLGQRAAVAMSDAGLDKTDVALDDDALWERQRAGQRSRSELMVRVTGAPSALEVVLRAAESAGGTLVGRVALGTSYVEVSPDARAQLEQALPAGARSVVLDAPPQLRGELDPWGPVDTASLELMRRIKARFDPANACNPGVFVGGI
jgi:glycolate oxidase FAD binding subunit